MRRRRRVAAALATAALVTGCSAQPEPDPGAEPREPSATPGSPNPNPTPTPSPTPTPTPTPQPPVLPPADAADVDPQVAMAAVRHLVEQVGPRPGHTRAYRQAADWVQGQLAGSGWQVRQERFWTPPGETIYTPDDGRPIAGGPSYNVVATRGDVRPGRPWLLVGAHLDTVPGSPGAEDNASGVGALLAVADVVGESRTRLPVVLVAFGSEEPRGPSDDEHHYGSRAFVASLTPAERRSLRGMVALDRVGVGAVVPVGSGGEDVSPISRELLATAERLGIPTLTETGQRSSDHWSFTRDGLPAGRLGSTPYAGYHSSSDTAEAISPDQLGRAARIAVAWLR